MTTSILSLPAEVRELIWEQLILSTIEEANEGNGRQYGCCKRPAATACPSLHYGYSRCQSRLTYLSSKSLHFVKVWRLRDVLGILYFANRAFQNPLLDCMLVNRQVRCEIDMAIRRTYPDGRYLLAVCCCDRSARNFMQSNPVITAKTYLTLKWEAEVRGEDVGDA